MSSQGRALPNDELLSIQEAADHVGLSVRTLRRYQATGRLAVVRVGRKVMCTRGAAEQAARDGGLELASRQMVDSRWEERPVRDWMAAWIDYTNLAPQDLQPSGKYVAYMRTVTKRFGDLPVREYRLKHLRTVHEDALKAGAEVPEVAMMLVLPDDLPVIDAVRQMQVRFSGRLHGEQGSGDAGS